MEVVRTADVLVVLWQFGGEAKLFGQPVAVARENRLDLLETPQPLAVGDAASRLEPFDSILTRSIQVERFRTYLLTCFAGIALILSAVGIFGFLSYTIGQRTREIGILMALGAPRNHIVKTIMIETVVIIGLAVVAGLATAFAVSRLIESLLFEVKPTDILTFLSVAIFVGLVATVSAYFPTRKTARLEVMEALRA